MANDPAIPVWKQWLQWVRRWPATETLLLLPAAHHEQQASMGPSLVSDGNAPRGKPCKTRYLRAAFRAGSVGWGQWEDRGRRRCGDRRRSCEFWRRFGIASGPVREVATGPLASGNHGIYLFVREHLNGIRLRRRVVRAEYTAFRARRNTPMLGRPADRGRRSGPDRRRGR